MQENTTGKIVFTKDDICERYGVHQTKAYAIIRAIRRANAGGKLPRGKVLWTELQRWEHLCDAAGIEIGG